MGKEEPANAPAPKGDTSVLERVSMIRSKSLERAQACANK